MFRKSVPDIAREPAMTEEELSKAFNVGLDLAADHAKRGYHLIATGDMGIGNTTPSSAIVAVLARQPPEVVTGRGTGLDDEHLRRKIKIIEKCLGAHELSPDEPFDVLCKIGGLEIAAITGLALGAAANGLPVVIDGFISTAAALVACKAAPNAVHYFFQGHRSAEPGHAVALEEIGLRPILDLDMRLGEGTGAVLAMSVKIARAAHYGPRNGYNSSNVRLFKLLPAAISNFSTRLILLLSTFRPDTTYKFVVHAVSIWGIKFRADRYIHGKCEFFKAKMKNRTRILVKFFISIFIMTFFISDVSNAAWEWQNPLPQGSTLKSVYFIDNFVGYAVGYYGTIIKTTDGGNNWIAQSSGTTKSLYSVHFPLDATTGYTVGADGTIRKTTNGGDTWFFQNSGTTDALYSVYCPTDTMTCYAAGGDGGSMHGTILKTVNGGSSWTEQVWASSYDYTSIHCPIDDNVCYASSKLNSPDRTIFKTENGGSSWSGQSASTIRLNSVLFPTDTAGNEDTAATNEELDYTIDTTPPTQSAWNPAKSSTITTTSPTITFTTDENADCKWSLSDEAYSAMTGDCTGDGTTSQSCVTSGLSEGANIVYTACRDTSGNEDTVATNKHIDYTVDMTPPVQSAWNPAKSSTISTTSPTITFTTDENADCKWSLADQTYSAMTGDCTGDGTTSQTCVTSGLSEGANVIYTACRDTAGNEDTVATNEHLDYTVDTSLPAKSNFDPAKGTTITTTAPVITFDLDKNGDCKWSLSDEDYDTMAGDCTGDGTMNMSCSATGLYEGSVIRSMNRLRGMITSK